jgi:hypothetical protein
MPYGSNYRNIQVGQKQPRQMGARQSQVMAGEAPRPKKMQPYKRPTGQVKMSNWARFL